MVGSTRRGASPRTLRPARLAVWTGACGGVDRPRTARVAAPVRISRVGVAILTILMVLDLVAAALAVGIVAVDPVSLFAAGLSHTKVAIVVGPVGNLTDYYRELADQAALVARRHSDNVVTVYSPDATWPAVRRALDGFALHSWCTWRPQGTAEPTRYSIAATRVPRQTQAEPGGGRG